MGVLPACQIWPGSVKRWVQELLDIWKLVKFADFGSSGATVFTDYGKIWRGSLQYTRVHYIMRNLALTRKGQVQEPQRLKDLVHNAIFRRFCLFFGPNGRCTDRGEIWHGTVHHWLAHSVIPNLVLIMEQGGYRSPQTCKFGLKRSFSRSFSGFRPSLQPFLSSFLFPFPSLPSSPFPSLSIHFTHCLFFRAKSDIYDCLVEIEVLQK